MPAIHMMPGEIPGAYRRLASAVGADHWQKVVARQEAAIRANWFLGDYLRAEYAIAYQLDRLRGLVARVHFARGTAVLCCLRHGGQGSGRIVRNHCTPRIGVDGFAGQGSNLQPPDSKSGVLPIELPATGVTPP